MNAGNSLAKQIVRCSRTIAAGSGRKLKVIGLEESRAIAAHSRLTPLEVEITCLENGVVPMRYLRNIGTAGIQGQLKLLYSTVAICGAGGLGGSVIELLARQGIGHLVIIDNGRFVENNLNRQIMSGEDVLRRSKVKVAAQRVRRINSAIAVKKCSTYINDSSVDGLLKGCDVVVDALDSLSSRMVVEASCRRLKLPFVHGAIAGYCGQVMTVLPGDKGLSAIYGPGCDVRGVEAVTGNPSATPTAIAAWEVQEVVKLITGTGEPIRNRLLFVDFADGSLESIPLAQEGK
ncbi:MAG: HesA/MoeB/ThiF family protein [Dehalococcoidia bacterium]|nr:HesA/MoeB/ThiF family protein [Dehalococcoidia bacterium]